MSSMGLSRGAGPAAISGAAVPDAGAMSEPASSSAAPGASPHDYCHSAKADPLISRPGVWLTRGGPILNVGLGLCTCVPLGSLVRAAWHGCVLSKRYAAHLGELMPVHHRVNPHGHWTCTTGSDEAAVCQEEVVMQEQLKAGKERQMAGMTMMTTLRRSRIHRRRRLRRG
jgi:hypothetical protein